MESLGEKLGVISASITNRIEEKEERLSGIEDTKEDTDKTVKEKQSEKMLLTQDTREIQHKMKRPNLQVIGIEEK